MAEEFGVGVNDADAGLRRPPTLEPHPVRFEHLQRKWVHIHEHTSRPSHPHPRFRDVRFTTLILHICVSLLGSNLRKRREISNGRIRHLGLIFSSTLLLPALMSFLFQLQRQRQGKA
jgi:hypothetical protein